MLPTSQHQSSRHFRRATLAGCALILLITACGCLDIRRTRLPTFQAAHPASEAQAYQRRDPFPGMEIGPSTDTRPRDFDLPRTDARKAAEDRILQGLPTRPEAIPPGSPQSRSRYDNAVN